MKQSTDSTSEGKHLIDAKSEIDTHSSSANFPVVGIGASAGGLDAVSSLLSNLPTNTGMAFVVVQHLDRTHESKLRDIFAQCTTMNVLEVRSGVSIEPNTVYIIPANTTITVKGTVLELETRSDHGLPMPIDKFFKSLAEAHQDNAICVVLSGTGSDGMLGLEEIKATGGITFAQNIESAKNSSMPESAIHSGCVDFILTPEEIANKIAAISKHSYLEKTELDAPANQGDHEAFQKILLLLRAARDVDFSEYRDTTIKRRILRRMALCSKDSLSNYADHLEKTPAELEALFQDVLIGVTSFFRDPQMFDALKTSVFPEILKGKTADTPIRIWVPGCSTGQEAYSLAMALIEFLDDKLVRPAIQIFATDLNDTVSLEKARAGIYPETIKEELSPERLHRFFIKDSGRYRVNKNLRDTCIFARQNMATDPPFSHIDIISCRNVLIYLSPILQKRVLPTFHYALNPTGFLVLGSSETVGSFKDLFNPIDATHRIFCKKISAVRQYPHFKTEYSNPSNRTQLVGQLGSDEWQREADRMLLGQYAPAGVLVNDNLDILQFRGDTSLYLAPTAGEPSHNLARLAREGLFFELKSAVEDCRSTQSPVLKSLKVRNAGDILDIALQVLPVKLSSSKERCFLILFDTLSSTAGGASILNHHVERTSWKIPFRRIIKFFARPLQARQRLHEQSQEEKYQLQQELASAREYIRQIAGQHDRVTEDLKLANEEVLSSNEELQSTNEELETAKEELQSINEELTTVNEQLQNRNQELGRLNDDMLNLLGSASIPMVAVGIDLRIKRFTPAAGKLLNLLETDISRPLSDIHLALEVPNVEQLIQNVVETVQVYEKEVRDRKGHNWLLRIHPYRTLDNKIDGAVLVLLDIQDIKIVQTELREADRYTSALFNTVREPLIVLDSLLRVETVNKAFLATFKLNANEVKNRLIFEISNGRWNIPELRQLLEDILPKKKALSDFEVSASFPDLGEKKMLLNGYRMEAPADTPERILLAIEDITDRSTAEANLKLSEEQYRTLVAQVQEYAIFMVDTEGRPTSWNEGVRVVLGFDREEFLERSISSRIFPADDSGATALEELLREAEQVGSVENDRWMVKKDGSRFFSRGTITSLHDESGLLIGFTIVMRDQTEQKQLEEVLQKTTADLTLADERKNQFLAMLGHELRNPLAPIRTALEVMRRTSDEKVVIKTQDVINRQTLQLTRLIDDLLDVSRITRGKVDLKLQPLDLREVISAAIESSQPHVDAREQALHIDLPSHPLTVEGDPARLSQVFANLLNNASKFSARKSDIYITTKQSGSSISISVRDNGVGISPDILPHIFEIFLQGAQSSDRSQGGLGIGLTLVKSLVELHGGSVAVHSEGVDKGSEFVVTLTLLEDGYDQSYIETGEGAPEGILTLSDHSAAENHRILIVDDNIDSAQMLAHLLRLLGHEVFVASDGSSGLEEVKSKQPDVALLDIGLPKVDGYEVARQIRNEPQNKDMILIAMTGYGRDEDRIRSSEAGFNAHLVKPVNLEDIQHLLPKNPEA